VARLTLNSQAAQRAADDVRIAHTRWWDALVHADVVALDTLLADDLTFHSPIGTTSTKAEFVERVRSGFLKYESVTADEPPRELRLAPSTRLCVGLVC
jgi:uncharacterized protein DUF4440